MTKPKGTPTTTTTLQQPLLRPRTMTPNGSAEGCCDDCHQYHYRPMSQDRYCLYPRRHDVSQLWQYSWKYNIEFFICEPWARRTRYIGGPSRGEPQLQQNHCNSRYCDRRQRRRANLLSTTATTVTAAVLDAMSTSMATSWR